MLFTFTDYTCLQAYVNQSAKKEDVKLDTLSEWIKSIGNVVIRTSRRLKSSVNTRSESIFRDPYVIDEFSRLQENFVIQLLYLWYLRSSKGL